MIDCDDAELRAYFPDWIFDLNTSPFMYQIDIANNQSCLELDEQELTRIAERVLEEEQVAGAEISIAIVDNPTMHELNRQYLDHDYPTDVLSFLLECDPPESTDQTGPELRGRGKTLDGEIIVSADYASEEARKYGWSPQNELILYVIHGLLHLSGYDDLTSSELPIMRARERAMLAIFDLTPPTPDSAGSEAEATEESLPPQTGGADS